MLILQDIEGDKIYTTIVNLYNLKSINSYKAYSETIHLKEDI